MSNSRVICYSDGGILPSKRRTWDFASLRGLDEDPQSSTVTLVAVTSVTLAGRDHDGVNLIEREG